MTVPDAYIAHPPQVFFNVVFLEALASGRMWGEALAFVDEAMKAIPNRALHRPLLTWKAYCLAQVRALACVFVRTMRRGEKGGL